MDSSFRNQNINYRLFISQIIIILLIPYINVPSQEIQTQIQSNIRIYRPSSNGPSPVIIAIPGCSGVSLHGTKTDSGRPGDEGDWLFRRHYPRMAEKFSKEGFVVLLVDYLSSEGVLNTCNGEIKIKRVGEFIAETILLTKTIPEIDTSRIHVIGWSYGGAGVLSWLSNLKSETFGIKSAVTIYPGCGSSSPWTSSIPVLMILAGEDDIAPPSICTTLVQSLPDSTNVRVQNYPGARHGFDLAEGPITLQIGEGLTLGRDPNAGPEAWSEILAFLKND